MIKNIYHKNLGTINQNVIEIELDKCRFATFYFSYHTIIGIAWNDGKFYRKYISHNYWTRTTGKLLNKLEPDKDKRKNADDFKMAIDAMMAFLNS